MSYTLPDVNASHAKKKLSVKEAKSEGRIKGTLRFWLLTPYFLIRKLNGPAGPAGPAPHLAFFLFI